MKLNSKRDKRNYIIIALCMILVVMGVGYAAFSSLLTINGTANISNSWCLGFDNSKTNAYEITKGVSTGEAPTGTMTYSGDVCSTNLVPHSNLTAVFHQPGDQIEYTLTIKNASTVTAAIKSIKVDNQNITGNTTKTKGNITFTINFPAKTTLTSNETTTMTIIAKFQNETDVTGAFAGSESQTISVELNGEQDDGNGGIVPTPSKFTGTIYRNNENVVAIGDSIVPGTKNVWCAVRTSDGESFNSCDFGTYWKSENECNQYLSDNNMEATCGQKTVTFEGVGDYTTDASTLNKNVYLKHDVVDDIIINSYVCFVLNNKEYSFKEEDFNSEEEFTNYLTNIFGEENCGMTAEPIVNKIEDANLNTVQLIYSFSNNVKMERVGQGPLTSFQCSLNGIKAGIGVVSDGAVKCSLNGYETSSCVNSDY